MVVPKDDSYADYDYGLRQAEYQLRDVLISEADASYFLRSVNDNFPADIRQRMRDAIARAHQ